MNSLTGGSLSSVPNGQIIDFEDAELRKVPFQDSLYLWVRGRLPNFGVEVKLAPRLYNGQPEYWGIEVAIITQPDPANDTGEGEDPLVFERSVPLTGITGTKGITVIGANRVKRMDISGES